MEQVPTLKWNSEMILMGRSTFVIITQTLFNFQSVVKYLVFEVGKKVARLCQNWSVKVQYAMFL